MPFEIDLSNQVVLVTGGTQGIGRGVVEAMLSAGANVAFCAPDQSECNQAAGELAKAFPAGNVLAKSANLRDRESLSAFADAALERWGAIDTLVCNATEFGRPSAIEDVDYDVFLRVLHSNVINNFHLCRYVLPGMLERSSGSIILMTSITGYTTMPTNIPYSSSKAAITSMARSLAAQYAAEGIRVNCVSPGLIKTPASRDIWENEELAREYVREKIPMQRMGEPADIANMCVFLASPLSQYISAAVLPVDGGRLGIGQMAGSNRQFKRGG